MALRLTPLSPHTGIEATGVDLREPLPPAVRDELYQAWLKHSVLVVRGQDLTAHEMLNAAKRFGAPFVQHNTKFRLEDCPEVHYISNQDRFPDGRRYIPGAGYHTDHSNAPAPPKATVLHAKKLPSSGGDTQFVNMGLAFETLAADLRERIDGLEAEHVYQSSHSARKLVGLTKERAKEVAKSVVHPLVRAHPETARKSIYINPIRIERILGMENDEALPLLETLLAHAIDEAHEYRHRWQDGDFVMWDNRNLLHKANGDYDMQEERYLYRLMLEGDAPR